MVKATAKTEEITTITKGHIQKGTGLYLSRCMPTIGTFDVYELKVRTVEDNWFVGVEKLYKQAFLLPYSELNKTIFYNRDDALRLVQNIESQYNIERRQENNDN